MQRKITIADLARESGVSKGTVDRVLHNRGRVSHEAKVAVEQAKEKLGYRPNLLAQNLKRNKVYRLFLLLPNPEMDHYWSQLGEIRKLFESKLDDLNIDLVIEYFDPFSQASFKRTAKSILNTDLDFLILATQFYNESLFLIQQLKQKEIPVVVFNSRIEVPGVLSYVGQDLIQSGRTAARLTEILNPKGAGIALIHVDEDPIENGALKQKAIGLKQYFSQKVNFKVQEYQIQSENGPLNEELFEYDQWIISNSRAYAMLKKVKNQKKIPKIIAYDLIEPNIELLMEQKIQFILSQPILKQVEMSIESAIDYLIFSKTIPIKQFSPLEIKISQNL